MGAFFDLCPRVAVAPVLRLRPALYAAAVVGAHALYAAGASAGETSARSIVELQPYREASEVSESGERERSAVTLTNLNPHINRWFLLEVRRDAGPGVVYHLDNPAPSHQSLRLAPATRGGHLLIGTRDGESHACAPWSGQPATALDRASRAGVGYAPLCEGRLYLRNRSVGYRTTRELVTEILRDRVWGGEKIIAFVRDRVLRDAHLERSQPGDSRTAEATPTAQGPMPAVVDPAQTGGRTVPPGLGIELDLPAGGKVAFGDWYPAHVARGVFVSILQAGMIDRNLLASNPERVGKLDPVESSAIVYLAAFDLAQHGLGFEVGTDHPRVGWSERILPEMRDAASPGPDGIDTIAPLVATGLVHPADIPRTVATFTGGFKRAHGAFRYGKLAQVNRGTHYGWMQHGIVFSSLQPALATVLVLDDGGVEMRAWSKDDSPLLPRIVHARQNGVPILETDPASGKGVPGALVNSWGAGNWSGSSEGKLRTVRAGLCLQSGDAGRYLVYAYFSSVTPSAMARVFQAYRCRAAMQLDMNALEHTYLAIYGKEASGIIVQHLVRGMAEVDKTSKGQPVPRFIGYPDNREFFVVLRNQEVEP